MNLGHKCHQWQLTDQLDIHCLHWRWQPGFSPGGCCDSDQVCVTVTAVVSPGCAAMPSAGSGCLWKLSPHCGDTSSSWWLQIIPLSTSSCRGSLEMGMQEEKRHVGLLPSCPRAESCQCGEQSLVSDVCPSLWPAESLHLNQQESPDFETWQVGIFRSQSISGDCSSSDKSNTACKVTQKCCVSWKVGEPACSTSCAKSVSYQSPALFREITLRGVNRLWILKHTLFNRSNKLQTGLLGKPFKVLELFSKPEQTLGWGVSVLALFADEEVEAQ